MVHHADMAAEYTSLTHLRDALGLTTDQIATRLGVAQSTVVRAEQSEKRGTISVDLLKRFASALGMTLEYKFVPDRNANKINLLDSLRKMSLEEKLAQAIELSEIALRLRDAPKRPR
jgi:transcriptional regulator with XRE-family HTH domain